MAEAGCDSVVMEVSSQGLMLHRTAGIQFEIGIFTNLGEDHIGPNEHKDFEDYKRCKGILFTPVSYTHLDVYKRQARSCSTGGYSINSR